MTINKQEWELYDKFSKKMFFNIALAFCIQATAAADETSGSALDRLMAIAQELRRIERKQKRQSVA